MTGEQWIIYWNEFASDTYMYGSRVTFHKKDHVEFVNPLMPPGTIMKQWYSKTNYQLQRIEPSLPIIDGETEYQIILNIDTPAGESCLVRLVYYDKYEVEVGTLFLRDKVTNFRCPLKTYSYRLQLINSGVSKLDFHSIVIREIIHEDDEKKNRCK